MKKFALILVAMMMISAAPPDCGYTAEVKQLATRQLKWLDESIAKTEPFSPPREVLAAQAIGILIMLDGIDQWEKDNCSES